MILHLSRMCKKVNRNVYNDQKNVSATASRSSLQTTGCVIDKSYKHQLSAEIATDTRLKCDLDCQYYLPNVTPNLQCMRCVHMENVCLMSYFRLKARLSEVNGTCSLYPPVFCENGLECNTCPYERSHRRNRCLTPRKYNVSLQVCHHVQCVSLLVSTMSHSQYVVTYNVSHSS